MFSLDFTDIYVSGHAVSNGGVIFETESSFLLVSEHAVPPVTQEFPKRTAPDRICSNCNAPELLQLRLS